MLLPNQVLITFWGIARLRRWPLESLRDVSILPQSKTFLSDVGLPRWVDWGLRFDGPNRLPRPFPESRPSYCEIGTLGSGPSPTRVCLDESTGGHVLFAGGGGSDSFANSSVEQLATCLVLYEQWIDATRSVQSERWSVLTAQFRNSIIEVDDQVLATEGTFWGGIVEDMELY